MARGPLFDIRRANAYDIQDPFLRRVGWTSQDWRGRGPGVAKFFRGFGRSSPTRYELPDSTSLVEA